MQNKVSYVVIIVLAFVCLVLSLSIGRGDVAFSPAGQGSNESAKTSGGWNVVSLSEQKHEMFVADEYRITFKIVQKNKEKGRAFNLLKGSREKIISLFDELGLEKTSYEHHSMSITNDVEYRNGEKILLGYVASQEFVVRLPNKSRSEEVERNLATIDFVDDLKTIGALKNADSLEVETIKRTCKQVLKQADVYARSVGVEAGKVLAVEGNSEVDEYKSFLDSVGIGANLKVAVQLKGGDESNQAYVQVSEGETKKFLADLFEISAGAVIDGDNRDEIYSRVGRVKDSIVTLAKKLGVAESEIEVHTVRIGVKPKWEKAKNESKKNRFRARQFVTVRFLNKQDAAAFLAEVGGADNVTVSRVNSVLKNRDSLEVVVAKIVGQKAMARAKAIAEGFDGRLGEVVFVGNNSSDDYSIVSEVSYESFARGKTVLGKRRSMGGFAFDGLAGLLGGGDAEGMIADSVEISSSINVIAELNW